MSKIIFLFISFAFGQVLARDLVSDRVLCKEQNALFVPVKIDSGKVIRADVPTTLFGFHHPWYDFQTGFFHDGKVSPEVLGWLKYFPGAVYRFPGGNSYDWQRAVGNNYARAKMRARYSKEGFVRPDYGLPEFIDFLRMVNGKAIVMLNLVGPDGKLSPINKMVEHNVGMVNWFRDVSAFKCSSGKNCPIIYWELGNELDWPDTRWSAETYLSRAMPLVSKLRDIDPGISLAVLGKTAPWNTETVSEQFNSTLANGLAKDASGVTLHPYYDGLPIPVMTEWINRTVAPYQRINPQTKVVITEHGRWPTQKSDNWEDDWYKASGSMGAISSADFIMSVMENPNVDVAAWHALSALGPWQLFHIDKKRKEIYPSAVYWGLRVIRDAFLTDLIDVYPSKILALSYRGGYDFHIAAMKDNYGHISVLGVNRGNRPLQFSFEINNGGQRKARNDVVFKYLKADALGSDNSDDSKTEFVMERYNVPIENSFLSGICVPPFSVFSILN